MLNFEEINPYYKKITLIGMMGTGKSKFGRQIANILKYNFYDIDHLIEKEFNFTIKKIFQKHGEVFFREIEKKITLNILKNKKGVIALGGGAFINKSIKKEVLDNHLSVWLDWDSNTLINRIKNSKKRPLAFNLSKSELIEIINKRSTIYAKALYKINCNNLTKQEIAKKVVKLYEAH